VGIVASVLLVTSVLIVAFGVFEEVPRGEEGREGAKVMEKTQQQQNF